MARHLRVGSFLSLAALAFGAIFFSTFPVQAQQTPASASNTQLATDLTNARSKNLKLMQKYSWTTRTEVKIKGEQKVLKSEAVHYSPDGKLMKAPLGQAGDSGKKTRGIRGRVKGRVVERKKGEMRDWAGDLKKLLQAYSLPTAGKVLDFINASKVSKGPEPGRIIIQGVNVVNPGDNLTFTVDSRTKALLETKVQTHLDGDLVLMRTVYRALDSGLNYTAESTVTVPGKKIELKVQNFSFIKN